MLDDAHIASAARAARIACVACMACMACISRSMEKGLQLPQTSCPQTLTLVPSPSPGVDGRLAALATLAMLESDHDGGRAARLQAVGRPASTGHGATDTGPAVDCVRELEANCIFQSPSAPHDPRA